MFPIKTDVPTRRASVAVYALIILNAYIFSRELSNGPGAAETFIDLFGLIPARDFHASARPWLPFLTSMFLHGGILHIISNMWALWIFGEAVEGALGPMRFLGFYVLSGIGAAWTHAYLNPLSRLPVVGASGAIAGVMAAYLLLFPRSRLRMFTLLIFYPLVFELPAVVFLALWFTGQLLSAASVAQIGARDVGGIAFAAHIGGFLSGFLLLPVFRRRRFRA